MQITLFHLEISLFAKLSHEAKEILIVQKNDVFCGGTQ